MLKVCNHNLPNNRKQPTETNLSGGHTCMNFYCVTCLKPLIYVSSLADHTIENHKSMAAECTYICFILIQGE